MRIISLSADAEDGTVLEKARPEIARFISDQACSILLVVLLISCVRKSFCVLCPNTQMPLKDISNPSVRRIFTAFCAVSVFLQMVVGFIPLPPFPAHWPVVCPLHVSKMPFQEQY